MMCAWKQNINGKERNVFPIIFCMFFSIFPPRPSHTSHSRPLQMAGPDHQASRLVSSLWPEQAQVVLGHPDLSQHILSYGNRGSIVPLFHLLRWALAPCWLPAFISHLFSPQLSTGFLISPWIYEACSLLSVFALVGPPLWKRCSPGLEFSPLTSYLIHLVFSESSLLS